MPRMNQQGVFSHPSHPRQAAANSRSKIGPVSEYARIFKLALFSGKSVRTPASSRFNLPSITL